MAERPIVEFFFSPGSRYSYLAASRIPALEVETGCTVDWRPVDGSAIRKLRGRDPFVGDPLSGQYEWAYRRLDAERWADYYGIPFREPPSHRFDFDLLVRAATASKRLGAVADYAWRLCAAVYGSGTWPIDEAACVMLATAAGLPESDFRAMLGDPDTARIASATAEEAVGRGAFGVPTFFLGTQMFWGNDRLALLRYALAHQR